MKKFIAFLLIAGIAGVGVYFFLDQKGSLPRDYDTIIMLWQKERAKELQNIFSLWADMPVGNGEKNIDLDVTYGALNFTGKISGNTASDINKNLSLWNAQIDVTGKTNNAILPLPTNAVLKGPVQIIQADSIYIIPGQDTIQLPLQSAALQKQLQEILNLASGKTLKITEESPKMLKISDWIVLINGLRSQPIFLLAREDGETAGKYHYIVSLTQSYNTLFPDFSIPLTNCQLVINKKDINDWLLDCRSSDTRIIWSSHAAKIIYDPQYKTTYEISLAGDVTPKWIVDVVQAGESVAHAEVTLERIDNRLTWKLNTKNMPTNYSLDLKGEESRTAVSDVGIVVPETFTPWEEMTKELVY